jgi:hypothetical protein
MDHRPATNAPPAPNVLSYGKESSRHVLRRALATAVVLTILVIAGYQLLMPASALRIWHRHYLGYRELRSAANASSAALIQSGTDEAIMKLVAVRTGSNDARTLQVEQAPHNASWESFSLKLLGYRPAGWAWVRPHPDVRHRVYFLGHMGVVRNSTPEGGDEFVAVDVALAYNDALPTTLFLVTTRVRQDEATGDWRAASISWPDSMQYIIGKDVSRIEVRLKQDSAQGSFGVARVLIERNGKWSELHAVK